MVVVQRPLPGDDRSLLGLLCDDRLVLRRIVSTSRAFPATSFVRAVNRSRERTVRTNNVKKRHVDQPKVRQRLKFYL